MKEFRLPDPGEGLVEADIVRWVVAEGDEVKVNDILVEIETSKSIVELPSPWAGRIARLMVEEGATVEVGAPIVLIDDGVDAPATPDGDPGVRRDDENVRRDDEGTEPPSSRARPGISEPVDEVVAAEVVEPPAPAAEPSPLRGVSTAVSGLAVTGGLGRGQFSPRADRAAADLGRCVAQAGRDQPGFTAPATATVSLRVRDQRLDEARVAGLPGFARACEGSVRGAFDGSLPAADDAEYDLRFSVTLTPQR